MPLEPSLEVIIAALGILIPAGIIIRNHRRDAFRKKTDPFIQCFNKTIADLQSGSSAYWVLSSDFSLHRNCAIRFQSVLPWLTKRKFNKTWRKYEAYCQQILDGKDFVHDFQLSFDHTKGESVDPNNMLLRLIDNLMSFAKEQ